MYKKKVTAWSTPYPLRGKTPYDYHIKTSAKSYLAFALASVYGFVVSISKRSVPGAAPLQLSLHRLRSFTGVDIRINQFGFLDGFQAEQVNADSNSH